MKNLYGIDLTEDEKDALFEKVKGSSMVLDGFACDEFNINLEDLEEFMLESGFQRCSECGYWCEIAELDAVEDEDEDGICLSCR